MVHTFKMLVGVSTANESKILDATEVDRYDLRLTIGVLNSDEEL